MENLFDKLNPEFKLGLENNRKKYGTSVDAVINRLKAKSYHCELTIAELLDLCVWSDADNKDIDWKFGENIFKN